MSRTSALKDVRRFMRSPDGQSWLEGIREILLGRTIQRITFAAEDSGVATTLYLDNNEIYRFTDEELTLESIYERYSAFFFESDSHP